MPSDPITAGLVVLVPFLLLVSLGLIRDVLKARREGRTAGRDFLRAVLPWMVAEGVGLALFVVYVLTNG